MAAPAAVMGGRIGRPYNRFALKPRPESPGRTVTQTGTKAGFPDAIEDQARARNYGAGIPGCVHPVLDITWPASAPANDPSLYRQRYGGAPDCGSHQTIATTKHQWAARAGQRCSGAAGHRGRSVAQR